MTMEAKKARLAAALQSHAAGGSFADVRNAYASYAGGTYGLDYNGLMIAARTLVECRTLKARAA